MIEKSRLEELIKQGATIYTSRFKKPEKYKLYKDFFIAKDELFACNKSQTAIDCVIKLSKLFETEKEAEWALKYQRIPRTEYLDLPMWKEIKDIKNEDVVYFYAKDKRFGTVCIHIFTKYFNVESEYDMLLNTEFTEENYIKACDLCVKLFKGESDE